MEKTLISSELELLKCLLNISNCTFKSFFSNYYSLQELQAACMVHACNLSTLGSKAGRSPQVQDQSELQNKALSEKMKNEVIIKRQKSFLFRYFPWNLRLPMYFYAKCPFSQELCGLSLKSHDTE